MKSKRIVLFGDYAVPPADPDAKAACLAAALEKARRVPRAGVRAQLLAQLAWLGPWFWAGLAAIAGVLLFIWWRIPFTLAPWESLSAPTLALFGACGPLLAALAAPVLARSHSSGMWELEEAAYHNLPRLTLLRMLLCGLAALPVLALMLAFGAGHTGLFAGLVVLAAPFLLACAACYTILGRLRGLAGSLCSAGACLVLALLCSFPFSTPDWLALLLAKQGWWLWGLAALMLSAGLCALAARGFIRAIPLDR